MATRDRAGSNTGVGDSSRVMCETKNDQADLGSESEHVRAPVNVGRVTPIAICWHRSRGFFGARLASVIQSYADKTVRCSGQKAPRPDRVQVASSRGVEAALSAIMRSTFPDTGQGCCA